MDLRSILNRIEYPKEYPKPLLVVPDNLVEAFQKAYPYATVIPVSETRLPFSASAEQDK